MFELLPLETLIALVVVALGLSIILVCTKAAFPLRFLWCALWRWKYTRWLWNIFTCPHCNAAWTGFGVSLLAGYHWLYHAPQVAVSSCLVMYLLQVFKNGDQVITEDAILTAHIECPDYFGKLFGIEEESDE